MSNSGPGLSTGLFDQTLRQEKDYWSKKLSGAHVVAGIPADFKRPAAFTGRHNKVEFIIEPSVARKLLQVCECEEALVFAILVAILKICIYKYTAIEDIIVGTTIHERHKEMASLNKVLALRDLLSGVTTVKQLLTGVKQTLSDAYANQKFPFERILDLLGAERPGNTSPLFNTVIVLENINDCKNVEQLKNELTLIFSIIGSEIKGRIEYCPGLFKRTTIEVFRDLYCQVLQEALERPDAAICQLQLMSSYKRDQLLFELNAQRLDYPGARPIHQLFEEQVLRTPDNIAVSFEDQTLSYQQLNQRANKMARHLRALGVRPGILVGICLEHSPEELVGLLGILKAGGAYVPLDTAHPKARSAFMIKDAGISVLLTEQRLAAGLGEESRLICIDSDWETIARLDGENLPCETTADDLAYVIYTSGSSGEPKGVKIKHSALVNYIWWARHAYVRDESVRFPLYSSLAFDLTVTSIFTPLITGNTIIIYRKDENGVPLLRIMLENKSTILKLTPSHLTLIKNLDNSNSKIRRIIVGGEAFETELAKRVHESFGGEVEIINEYGPTEATVGCMLHKYDPAKDDRAFVPIGKPAANAQIYILDESLNPVPENVLGELYISGDGLAQGYLNRDGLTGESFITNPFISGQRMYKTGDLARWLPEGVIEYVGRADDQIKFHGYRVELNEIRCALNQHPQVRDSVVVFGKDRNGSDMLMAYYVSRQKLDAAQLRDFLRESIFEETIPNIFIHLRKLPLTLNGKVNYGALPTLEQVRQVSERGFVGPRDETEQILAEVWAQVLGIERVGIYDNFFELGGHSLMATQVASRVRRAFKVDLPMRKIFELPTVADLAEYLIRSEREGVAYQRIKKADSVRAGKLLSRIDQLSDAEVNALLGEIMTKEGAN